MKCWPRYLVRTVIPPVATVVGASVYLDSKLYGAATLVPINFLRFNVLEGQSKIFGEQAWHWNFSQGLPAVLGAALPPALWRFFVRSSVGGGGKDGRSVGSSSRILGWLAVWFLGENLFSFPVECDCTSGVDECDDWIVTFTVLYLCVGDFASNHHTP